MFVVPFGLLMMVGLGLVSTACAPAGDDEGDAVTCVVEAGQCPNFCANGLGVVGEACESSRDCSCGNFCKVDGENKLCAPYEGDLAACSCEAGSGGGGGAGGGGGGGGGMMMSMGGAGGTPMGPDINDCDVIVGPSYVCNPYCNLGCREGQHCTMINSAIDCVQTGEGAISDPCGTSADCGERMSCVRLRGEENGSCRQFCTGDADCPGGRRCDLGLLFGADDRLAMCGDIAVGCNPFEMPPSACADGQGCYINREATRCMTAGMTALGEPCDGPSSCASGLQCLVVCTDICSLDGTEGSACDECPSGEHDARISPDNNVGLCLTEDIPAVCDIYTQMGCPPGEGCYGLRGGHGCLPAGARVAGAVCDSGNQCTPGTTCINGSCLPVCTHDMRRPPEQQCETLCPGEFINLTPTVWQQGVCTNVMAEGACDFWNPMCEGGQICVPTIVGNTCRDTSGMRAEDEACQDHTDCATGLLCPRDINVCRPACSVAPFVAAPAGVVVLICEDDCPNGVGMPIERGSDIGFCP